MIHSILDPRKQIIKYIKLDLLMLNKDATDLRSLVLSSLFCEIGQHRDLNSDIQRQAKQTSNRQRAENSEGTSNRFPDE